MVRRRSDHARRELRRYPDRSWPAGPLTSPALTAELQRLTGADHLSLLRQHLACRGRHHHQHGLRLLCRTLGQGFSADYINCPFTREEYEHLLRRAGCRAWRSRHTTWERLDYFEGCLPIEEIARRGKDTLRFGCMKPVGLRDPRTGQTPYAVVQLRCENLRADSYNLVGFQNHLKFGDQARVLRLIPGLGERHLPALRPDPPQHLHQQPHAADGDAAAARPPAGADCRTAVRRGGLHRINCGRHARRAALPPHWRVARAAHDPRRDCLPTGR